MLQGRDEFRVLGRRVDNDSPTVVYSKKSTSGQHLPEVGGVLRADKATRIAAKSNEKYTSYDAQYFHAYGKDDLCLRAVAQAQRPKLDQSSNIWSADMRLYDIETAPVVLDGNQLEDSFEKELERLLKPWDFPEKSSITHDVQGKPVWGVGEARSGFSPFVAVRSGSKTFYVYGDGAVRKEGGSAESKEYTLPSDERVRSRVQRAQGVQNLLTVLRSVKEQAGADKLGQLKVSLIPGLQIRVGMEALGGQKQSYLAVPEAFDWVNKDSLDPKGNPTSYPGYRPADIHVKESRTNRYMVVDASPSAGGRLTQFIPETRAEREMRAESQHKPAAQNTREQEPPQQAQPQKAERQQVAQSTQTQAAPRAQREQKPSEPAASTYDAPAINAFDDPIPDSFGDMEDFDSYAEDLAMMQDLQAQQAQPDFDDADFETLLAEATEQQNTRKSRNRPSM